MAQETKHTPLEWQKIVVSSTENITLKIGIFPKKMSICIHPIARVEINERYNSEQAEANAEFICRAVNNYERLVEIIEDIIEKQFNSKYSLANLNGSISNGKKFLESLK